MDLKTFLSGASLAAGLGKSLFGTNEDPYDEMREVMERILAEMEAELPKVRSGIQQRGANRFAAIANRLSDQGAAAGLPRNVIGQNVLRAKTATDQLTESALGQFDQWKQGQLGRIAQMYGMVPAKPYDTTGQNLMQLGILGLLSGGKKNGEGLDVNSLLSILKPKYANTIGLEPETELLPDFDFFY